jgi:sulfur transfer complex TusBCD TusB component (DsrH family)
MTIVSADRLPRKARIMLASQDVSARGIKQKIDETHTASIAEFELAKYSQEIANKEMAQITEVTSEIHKLIRGIEKRRK